ncbi:MAG TPA: hypothetical protein GXX14_04210 [Clostridiaceae bacterium]|nr:hypothetical protein [Clostridiaceae bacterium]
MSIIFTGIVLIIVALVSVLFDRKKSWDFDKRIDEKKQELLELISDAEEMVNELNRISDYIVTQVNAKSDELRQSLRECESKLKEINSRVCFDANNDVTTEKETDIKSIIIENKNSGDFSAEQTDNVLDDNNNEKGIPVKAKYREVLQLAEKGLTDTEIAKRLNIGKGEIQLILELNR